MESQGKLSLVTGCERYRREEQQRRAVYRSAKVSESSEGIESCLVYACGHLKDRFGLARITWIDTPKTVSSSRLSW